MANVLIAAGGTGGHIYPALAIADAFKVARPDLNIEFVGTAHGLENKIVPPKGYKVNHLPIGRLNSNVSLRERLTTVVLLPWAILKSFLLIWRKKPDFVLGVGGHASGPLLLAAAILRVRSAIWEPNAMPGMANRILSRFVDESFVVFPEARAHLRGGQHKVAGMPVRQEIEDMAMESSRRDPVFHILVFGGSQGARALNSAVVEMVRHGGEWLKTVHITHQTGAADFQRIKEAYGPLLQSAPVDLREYLHDMGNQYSKADLVICRSGTGTLSELAACGKASVLVPFPYAADDHQRKNAESLVNKGAALMILHKDLNPTSLRAMIERLQNNPEERARLSENIRTFHQPRAAQTLVSEFLERMPKHASC